MSGCLHTAAGNESLVLKSVINNNLMPKESFYVYKIFTTNYDRVMDRWKLGHICFAKGLTSTCSV